MLYCLFKHSAATAFKDLVARVGNRVLVKRATLRTLKNIAGIIGVKVTQRVASKAVTRFIPLIGAIGVAVYAYQDTKQVGTSAKELFRSGKAD